MEKVCTNCGKKIEEGAVFCGGCGQPVHAQQDIAQQMGLEPTFTKNRLLHHLKRKEKSYCCYT